MQATVDDTAVQVAKVAMKVIEAVQLSVAFGGVQALSHVDLEVDAGEIFGLIGPNGSGKTTFFNVVSGFIKPSDGSVIYMGESLRGLPPHEIAARGVGRTFQITSLFPNLTCEENITIGRHLRTKGNVLGAIFQSRSYRRSVAAERTTAREIARLVGVQDRLGVLARQLSSGDQRKLEVAVALAGEPRLLLLDEPAAGLTADEANDLMTVIRSIAEKDVTILVVEHNMRMVMGLCTRVAVLNRGVKIACGPPVVISRDAKVIDVYLGQEDERP